MNTILQTTSAFLILCSANMNAQCNVKTNYRPDGIIVNYMNPNVIGKGTGCELGISLSTDGSDFYFNTSVLYFNSPKKIEGELLIELSNNKSLMLQLFTSELATINGSDVSVSVFLLTNSDVYELSNNRLKKVVFKENGGRNQIVMVNQNSDLASKQIKCLR